MFRCVWFGYTLGVGVRESGPVSPSNQTPPKYLFHPNWHFLPQIKHREFQFTSGPWACTKPVEFACMWLSLNTSHSSTAGRHVYYACSFTYVECPRFCTSSWSTIIWQVIPNLSARLINVLGDLTLRFFSCQRCDRCLFINFLSEQHWICCVRAWSLWTQAEQSKAGPQGQSKWQCMCVVKSGQ